MNLFENTADPARNLLPYDGEAYYFGPLMSPQDASRHATILMQTIAWQQDELVLFGKKITTKRKVAWYGDQPFGYRYSGTTKIALAWTPALLELKAFVERHTGETYNACLLNLYHDGTEGMAWHSDDEPDLKPQGAIASLSLGVARKFAFRHKESKEKISVALEHGSILLMKGDTQTHWQHSLPPARRISEARINLTFRTIKTQTLSTAH